MNRHARRLADTAAQPPTPDHECTMCSSMASAATTNGAGSGLSCTSYAPARNPETTFARLTGRSGPAAVVGCQVVVKAKRARKAETPKQPSPCLRLRAPYLYPDHMPVPANRRARGYRITTDSADSRKFRTGSYRRNGLRRKPPRKETLPELYHVARQH